MPDSVRRRVRFRGLSVYNAAPGVMTGPDANPEIAPLLNLSPADPVSGFRGKVITKEQVFDVEVGQSVKITVQAIVPFGPRAGKVDTTLDFAAIDTAARFYVTSPEGLTALTAGGTALPYDANGSYVKFAMAGEATFGHAKSAVNGDSFSLSGVQNHGGFHRLVRDVRVSR